MYVYIIYTLIISSSTIVIIRSNIVKCKENIAIQKIFFLNITTFEISEHINIFTA